MNVLITGGSGFLGQAVIARMSSPESVHNFNILNFDIRDGNDILDVAKVRQALTSLRPHLVIHAAAIADLYKSDEDKRRNFDINVYGTFVVLSECYDLGIPVIYISTACAYGNVQNADEGSLPQPTETYAWSKLAGEKVIGCLGNMPHAILRLGTFYGPGMRRALFNALAIEKTFAGETIQIHADGGTSRQYVYIDDIADAVYRASLWLIQFTKAYPQGDSFWENPHIFNIVGDESIAIRRTIETVALLTGQRPKTEIVAQRPGQIFSQKISNQKAKGMLDWNPGVHYLQGMHATIEAYRNGAKFT